MLELRDYQLEAIERTRECAKTHQRVLIQAPTGCHAKDELILMYDGSLKKSQHIEVGDILMGPDSSPRKVLETHTGVDELYLVVPDKFDSYVVNSEHLLCLYKTREKNGDTDRYTTIKAKDYESKSKWFKHIHYLYRSKAIEFKGCYKPKVSPYIIGVWLGDGRQLGPMIINPDKEVISAWEQEAIRIGTTAKTKLVESKHCFTSSITFQKKTENKFYKLLMEDLDNNTRDIPKKLLTMSLEDRAQLLSGLLDTDGSFSKKKHCYEITVKQEKFAQSIRFLCLSLGIYASKIQTKKVRLKQWKEARNYYRLFIRGDEKIKCRVERKKFDGFSFIKKNNISRFKVTRIGKGDYYGWTVTKDNLYLNKDLQVIHNSGKSAIIAGLISAMLSKTTSSSVLVLCHQAEILMQNLQSIFSLTGVKPAVYCASLKRKDTPPYRVLLASRDSVPSLLNSQTPSFSMLIIDEAHLVPERKSSRYQTIIDALKPKVVIGLTATPYRLDCGVIYGPKRFWQARSYNIPMETLRDRGYLVPYEVDSKGIIDPSHIKISKGDYDEKALSVLSSSEGIVSACCDAWKAWRAPQAVTLMFCVSIAHAETVLAFLRAQGHVAELITGDTPQKDRADIINRARLGLVHVLLTVGTLTTGVDIPCIDHIVFLRATMSASLFCQMAGRGLRTSPGKPKLRILDLVGNFDRFYSIEMPYVQTQGKRLTNDEAKKLLAQLDIFPQEEGATKECKYCKSRCATGRKLCPDCGELFLPDYSVGAHALLVLQVKFGATKNGSHHITYYVDGDEGRITEYFPTRTFQWARWNYERKLKQIQTCLPKFISAEKKDQFWKVSLHLGEKGSYSISSYNFSADTASKSGGRTPKDSMIHALADFGLLKQKV